MSLKFETGSSCLRVRQRWNFISLLMACRKWLWPNSDTSNFHDDDNDDDGPQNFVILKACPQKKLIALISKVKNYTTAIFFLYGDGGGEGQGVTQILITPRR